MAPLKILACGSIDGKYEKFFKKVSNLQKKNGPFEMIICTGDFFNEEEKEKWNEFKAKSKLVDVPIYILGPTSKALEKFYTNDIINDGGDVYENILYLGKKGLFKTSSGLTVAYISGSGKAKDSCEFTLKDIDHLIGQVTRISAEDKYTGVDILLTQSWPKDVMKFTDKKIVAADESALISKLASVLKPRYHLCCNDNQFLERTPYRNHQVLRGSLQHVSRFISLASFNNKTNQKSIYAFNITPITHISREELIIQPPNATEFPYSNVTNSTTADQEQSGDQFFFSKDNKRKSDGQQDRQHKVPRGPPQLKSACWFCLGSKEVEKHLVISVGEKCYVTLAKGALNNDHVLICPIMHHNSTVVSPDDVVMEMEKYKDCLRKMFESESKHMVTFERNYYTQHLQLQVIGVSKDTVDEIKDTFMDLAESESMEMIEVEEDRDISELVAVTTPYFAVEIKPGERLLHKVKGKMPLHFGREVLSSPSLLNLPDRIDWKNCKLDKEDEIKHVKDFRKRFEAYDFNYE